MTAPPGWPTGEVDYWHTPASLEEYARLRGHNQPLDRPYYNFQGNSVTLLPGQRAQLLRLQGVSRRDPESLVIHISAEPTGVGAIPNGTNSRPLVELDWGCGGTSHQAIADIGRGTELQLIADALDLAAVYDAPSVGAVGPALKFAATVTYGGRSSPGQNSPAVSFADGPYTLDPATPVVSRIPPFAKSAALVLANPRPWRLGAWTLIELQASQDATFTTGELIELTSADYASYPRPILLWPAANFYRAQVSGAGTSAAWVVYELAL